MVSTTYPKTQKSLLVVTLAKVGVQCVWEEFPGFPPSRG